MQSNQGWLWGAIIFLGTVAGVLGVVTYQTWQQSQTRLEELRSLAPEGIVQQYRENTRMRDHIDRLRRLDEEIAELRREAARVSETVIPRLRTDADVERNAKLRAEEEARRLRESAAANQATHQNSIASVRQQYDQRTRQQQANIDRLQQQISEAITRADRLRGDVLQVNETADTARVESIRQIRDLSNRLSNLQRRMESVSAAESEGVTVRSEEGVGRVLEVNTHLGNVFINLGSNQQLQPGMRFEVMRHRHNRWDVLGTIEVRRVHAAVSEAMIVSETRELKMDPTSGWTTNDPLARFSPYNLQEVNVPYSDTVEKRPVELITIATKDVTMMDILDPIMPGDILYNELFNPDRRLRFAILGDPTLHSRDEILAGIEQYGGLLTRDIVTTDTDYVILCHIPEEEEVSESPEAQARRRVMLEQLALAREYGITFMREVEFFRFVGRR